jgi:hypothetical protein
MCESLIQDRQPGLYTSAARILLVPAISVEKHPVRTASRMRAFALGVSMLAILIYFRLADHTPTIAFRSSPLLDEKRGGHASPWLASTCL